MNKLINIFRSKRRTYGFYFQPLVFPSDLLRSVKKIRNCFSQRIWHTVFWGLDWTGLVKRGLVKHGLLKRGLVKGGLVKRGLVKCKKNVGFINTIIYCQRTSQVKMRGIITLNINLYYCYWTGCLKIRWNTIMIMNWW